MHSKRRRLAWPASLCATAVLAFPATGRATPATALASRSVPAAAPAVPVQTTPAFGTPHLVASATGSDQIRQLVQCGSEMYAAGSFSQIQRQGTIYARSNVFSFSATAPYRVTSWAPEVNGVVNSITFSGGSCADAYIGGKFTAVGTTAAKNIAEIDTTTGKVVTTFGHNAAGKVETLLGYGHHVLAGGFFTSINGSSADPYLTSLSPVTGQDDGYLHLAISGSYQYPGVTGNVTNVYNQSLSHAGTLDLVMGDFTSAGGRPRQQIFMLNLAKSPPAVTGWTSPQWDGSQGEATPADPGHGYPYQCATYQPFYIRAASWSPDDSTIYLADTGDLANNWPASGERVGLCDAAAAFPSAQATVYSRWINYTGCDSLFSTAADGAAAYFGGHERWSMNSYGCDAQGPGGISAPGLEGLRPATGSLLLNGQGTALYSRSRGYGADDMLVTPAGLWIASDNFAGSQYCDGVSGMAGLCFLPYPAGQPATIPFRRFTWADHRSDR